MRNGQLDTTLLTLLPEYCNQTPPKKYSSQTKNHYYTALRQPFIIHNKTYRAV